MYLKVVLQGLWDKYQTKMAKGITAKPALGFGSDIRSFVDDISATTHSQRVKDPRTKQYCIDQVARDLAKQLVDGIKLLGKVSLKTTIIGTSLQLRVAPQKELKKLGAVTQEELKKIGKATPGSLLESGPVSKVYSDKNQYSFMGWFNTLNLAADPETAGLAKLKDCYDYRSYALKVVRNLGTQALNGAFVYV